MAETLAVHVAAVGAGYTTCLAGGSQAALIDFGAGRGSVAVDGLNRIASGPWPWLYWGTDTWPLIIRDEGFSEIVISHPHVDHYNGLLALARTPRIARVMHSLLRPSSTFFHPRVPDNPEATELLYRLAALNRVVSGLPEHELGRAIAACSAGPIGRQALVRNDVVTLAGHEVDVLWPPKCLNERCTSRLRNLVRAYDALALEAAQNNDVRLVKALQDVRSGASEVGIETAMFEVPEGDPEASTMAGDSGVEQDPPGDMDRDDGEDAVLIRSRALRKSISNGANLLSLALKTVDGDYVFLGDMDESLHAEIAGDLLDQNHEVLISAHHGTHCGPDLARVRSRYVISSVGGQLAANVCADYDRMGIHLRTDRAGDISVDIMVERFFA